MKKTLNKLWKEFINILPYNELTSNDFVVPSDDDLVYIDQDACLPSYINEAGWIRNDVSQFELASSESEISSILARFEEVKHQDLYKDMTEEEMFETVIRRRDTSDPVFYTRCIERFLTLQKKKVTNEIERAESEKQMKQAAKEKEAIETTVENTSVVSNNASDGATS